MKIAHQVALDAVTTLKHGRTRIIIRGNGSFSEVETGQHRFRFYLSHASYEKKSTKYEERFGFDIEEKMYLTSNHCSKISFWAPDDKMEERKKEILAFIDNLMAEAGVSIEPRFQLAQMTQ